MDSDSGSEFFQDLFEDAASEADSDFILNEDLDGSDTSADNEPDFFAPPIQHQRTAHLRARLQGQNVAQKVKNILEYMAGEGLDLPLFLDYLSWGDQKCISDPKVQFERTALLSSRELHTILGRWWSPPGGRAESARGVLKDFVVECTGELVRQDMARISSSMQSPPNPLSLESLTSLNFDALSKKLKSPEGCPTLWSILLQAGWSKEQAARNTHKTPENAIMNIVGMLSYIRSQNRNRITMLWSVYLKACGLSARAFDALHSIGLIMSHKWTTEAFSNIADEAMDAAEKAFKELEGFWSHDNLNIPKRVFSMRIENQSHFHSACAGTLWILPDEVVFPPDLNRELQETRREGGKEPFDFLSILDTSPTVYARTRARTVHQILKFLLDSPSFAQYEGRNDPILAAPPPVNQLPYGPEHITKQFILRTADIDEASYEGNEKVLEEWLRQLKLNSVEERKKTSTSRIIPIVGDQLTVDRLRGLSKYRHDDINGFERLDWVVPVNGFFHMEMAFANSLHKQYLGTSGGVGLRKAFDLLQRKGLQSTQIKGPFWHHLDEALAHVAEAHIRALWLTVGKTEELTELAKKTPEELVLLAEDIYDQYACRMALRKMEARGEKDEVKYQSIMFNADVLSYLDLREATRTGDVGRIEDLFPVLLMRFAGGGNNKYMIEILELLQCLKKEWPPALCDIVRKHCWLVNRTGKPDGFIPVDRAQEQNIKDLKVTYHSFGPGATLAYLTKISPAVPVLRAIKNHIKWQFRTALTRGDHHSVPEKEKDVAKYAATILEEKWFVYEEGRTLKKSEDRAKDVVTTGANVVFEEDAIQRWWKGRAFTRATQEKWLDEVTVSE